ncbi:hypothetical protein BDV09DRAFT_185868 [Aspergillus tetrazonus]
MSIPMSPLDAETIAAAKATSDEEGYAVMPSILNSSSINFTQNCETALHMSALDPNASNIRVFYLMELDAVFREVIQHPAALQVAELFVGDQLLVSNFTANIARPGSGSMQLHSDQSLVRKDEVPPNASSMLKPFVAKAGSVVVMDARVWHTSGNNVTQDQERALLFGLYTAPFLRKQVNWTAVFAREAEGVLSPELRELLRVDIATNVGRVSNIQAGIE